MLGAQVFAVQLIGVAMFREFAVVIAAVLLAGRSSSAFAAEIGSMRMNQEVDAMEVMGVNPFQALVVPRLAEALDALRAGGCRLQENERGSSIEVDGLAQVQDVFAVLQAGRIDYEVADLVSCAYQG